MTGSLPLAACAFTKCIYRFMSLEYNRMVQGIRKETYFWVCTHFLTTLFPFLSSLLLYPTGFGHFNQGTCHHTGCFIHMQKHKYCFWARRRLSHYLRIHWSSKRRKTIHVSSSVSFSDVSRVPFCSFYFSSWDFSPSFSFSACLHQMTGGICCPSSSLWSPRHLMTKQIWGVNKQTHQSKGHTYSWRVKENMCSDFYRHWLFLFSVWVRFKLECTDDLPISAWRHFSTATSDYQL